MDTQCRVMESIGVRVRTGARGERERGADLNCAVAYYHREKERHLDIRVYIVLEAVHE